MVVTRPHITPDLFEVVPDIITLHVRQCIRSAFCTIQIYYWFWIVKIFLYNVIRINCMHEYKKIIIIWVNSLWRVEDICTLSGLAWRSRRWFLPLPYRQAACSPVWKWKNNTNHSSHTETVSCVTRTESKRGGATMLQVNTKECLTCECHCATLQL